MGAKRFFNKRVFKPVKKRYTGKGGLKHIWKDTRTIGTIGVKTGIGYATGGYKGAYAGAKSGINQRKNKYYRGKQQHKKYLKANPEASKSYYAKKYSYKSRKYSTPYKRSTYSTPYKKSYYPRKTYSRGKDTVKIYMD